MNKVYVSKELNRRVVSFQGKEYPVKVLNLLEGLLPKNSFLQGKHPDTKATIHAVTKKALLAVCNNSSYIITFTYVEQNNEYLVSIANISDPLTKINVGILNEDDLDAVPEGAEQITSTNISPLGEVNGELTSLEISSGAFSGQINRNPPETTPEIIRDFVKSVHGLQFGQDDIRPSMEELFETFNTGADMGAGLVAVFELGQKRYLAK